MVSTQRISLSYMYSNNYKCAAPSKHASCDFTSDLRYLCWGICCCWVQIQGWKIKRCIAFVTFWPLMEGKKRDQEFPLARITHFNMILTNCWFMNLTHSSPLKYLYHGVCLHHQLMIQPLHNSFLLIYRLIIKLLSWTTF